MTKDVTGMSLQSLPPMKNLPTVTTLDHLMKLLLVLLHILESLPTDLTLAHLHLLQSVALPEMSVPSGAHEGHGAHGTGARLVEGAVVGAEAELGAQAAVADGARVGTCFLVAGAWRGPFGVVGPGGGQGHEDQIHREIWRGVILGRFTRLAPRKYLKKAA